MTNEMHNPYNQFLFHSFLYMFRTDLVVHQEHSILCRAADDERLDSFETCRADNKNCGIKLVITIVHLVVH